MESSHALLTAQVHFLDTHISLIHIPLSLYNYFVQPMIQLILPAESSVDQVIESSSTGEPTTRPKRPWAYEHPFVNISVTPVECSVACSTTLAQRLFKPICNSLDRHAKDQVSISNEQYIVIQVDGEGLDAGQRVLELSSPLAMNGISIFFYSTYFSDYILVPLRSRSVVINALEERGFAFSKESEGFVNISSPLMRPHRTSSTSSNLSAQQDSLFQSQLTLLDSRPPSTPPPSSVSELETRTFSTLRQRHVVPSVDPSIRLVQCAGRKDTLRGETGAHSNAAAVKHRLQLGLVKCLTTTPRPRFFSLSLTDTEPASLLLEKRLLVNFEPPNGGEEGSDDLVLLGSKTDVLVPITLDLKDLPIESTGIVCGIAGRLVGGTAKQGSQKEGNAIPSTCSFDDYEEEDTIEMSYLSTTQAGTVVIAEEELKTALEVLKGDEGRGMTGLPVEWVESRN